MLRPSHPRKQLLQSIRAEHAKAAAELDMLKAEILCVLRGESTFSKELRFFGSEIFVLCCDHHIRSKTELLQVDIEIALLTNKTYTNKFFPICQHLILFFSNNFLKRKTPHKAA